MSYTPISVGSPNAIRRFADKGIEDSMKRVLANLPAKRSGAVVMYADKGGVHGAVYGRKAGRFWGLLPAGEWTYVGTLGTSFQGKLDASAAVAYSWS